MATLVKFLYHESEFKNQLPDIFAFFPQLNCHKGLFGDTMKQSYSHIGQHSACNVEYANESRPATESEYLPLKQELESIGYELKVCK